MISETPIRFLVLVKRIIKLPQAGFLNKPADQFTKKRSKYGPMQSKPNYKMYQNAVYKSLNLNLSPSTSSQRSGNNSRDISLRDRVTKSGRKIAASTKAFEQNSADFKFHVKNDETSAERLYQFRKIHNNLKRHKSQNAKNKVSNERSVSNLYSPKDSNKILKHKSKIEMSVEKNKFNATLKNQKNEDDLTNRMREQTANPAHKNLYMSYRRTSKTSLKTIVNEVKPRLTNNFGNKSDDTFEGKHDISHDLQHSKSTKQQTTTRRLPVNYKSKNLANSNKSQSHEMDASNTMDSARYSELSNKSSSEYIKEFLEAAARGNRDKLDELLTSNKVNSINVTDLNHRSALHYAVSEGRFKTVGFLLSKNIDPNILSKIKKETALHLACKKAYKKIIVSLLNNEADPNIQDSNGKTGLHVISELNSREHLVAFINH